MARVRRVRSTRKALFVGCCPKPGSVAQSLTHKQEVTPPWRGGVPPPWKAYFD